MCGNCGEVFEKSWDLKFKETWRNLKNVCKTRICREFYGKYTKGWKKILKNLWTFLASDHITCLTDRVINQVLDPVCQWPYHSLTDRVFFIFLNPVFNPVRRWPSQSQRPFFFFIFFPSGRNWKKKWKNSVCETAIWPLAYMVENLIKKIEKKTVYETLIWSLAYRV